jgi:hypothetical protein
MKHGFGKWGLQSRVIYNSKALPTATDALAWW